MRQAMLGLFIIFGIAFSCMIGYTLSELSKVENLVRIIYVVNN